MSQFSFSSFDASLMVRDAKGHYQPATADQILEAARQAIEHKMQRGASFTSPAAVKEYLCAKLAGFEHEVFAVLFLDTQHRLIEYAEMFRGTIDSASVRIPRHGGHDSTLMADSVPASCRTPFHAEGGQHSKLMADT